MIQVAACGGCRRVWSNPDVGPDEPAELVERAVGDGRTLVVDRSDVLVLSNEVAVGSR
ncbi:hypothetical protein KCV87_31715 [Actinosynnema pretiosum subsp. pretiosum]|uniref:Uncharacterized protein n=1 Tax=Actinosynnema pretiosum subsp. pretiosum TaxID=103721 RepID=A0AA45L5W3_9PSEU|nr:hypothetical protein APASM_4795 [Actinosynnema pretiosum subsp. pretiosum]QUF03881.1 hypothetical protein KCV87_31715 [Actinosynnema pretiosum subsp. pretiosum]